jgi:uncharacterized membrane protein YoaK (UPF0700 family)
LTSSRAFAVPGLLSSERTDRSDATLGLVLTFVAGAINAGGLLVVGQYTSHMSGILSAIADNLALGALGLVMAGAGALLSFLAGAACSAILINWGRRAHRRSVYATPLSLEAILLSGFGLSGAVLGDDPAFAMVAVVLLCFVMGLQNATITKISGARIRTTHVTGMVTDLGIELGKLAYLNRTPAFPGAGPVVADRGKLRLLAAMLSSFFVGGVLGALAFQMFGILATLLLSLPLAALSARSFVEEARHQEEIRS